ncbi:type IV pilin [Methanoregula sp.]
MLVVTIIIAAVVSGFAGGLIGGGTPAAPTVSMDVKIVNTGSATGSGFFATVTGVSAPVQTHNLELITAWTTTSRTNGYTMINGGNTSVYINGSALAVPPLGYGPGVTSGVFGDNFGNYTLVSGTGLAATPSSNYGSVTLYQYSATTMDNTVEVLGNNWQNLKLGDTVTVTLVDVTSGKSIYKKTVPVTEG